MSEAAVPPILREPWQDETREHVAVQFGLWVFFATEALFFGGLLLFYAAMRWRYGIGFLLGAKESDVWFGTINTLVLMTSSVTMVLAETAAKADLPRFARRMLMATALLGLAFLVIKGFEYRQDIGEHLLPGADFRMRVPGAVLFWSFYWAITPLHATHLTIGIALVLRLWWQAGRKPIGPRWLPVEATALYWHLVDIVWVILYPLLYLAGRP